MSFIKGITEFFNDSTNFKYDRRHRAMYENINYFMKRINFYKNKWKHEYSTTGKLTRVDYSLIRDGMESLKIIHL